MRQAAEVENYMTSVERVLEFHKVESEESKLMTKPEHNLPIDWPTCGDVTFQNVCLRYSSTDPPVLKKLNFIIKSGEKVRDLVVLFIFKSINEIDFEDSIYELL